MDDAAFNEKLKALIDEINTLPPDQKKKLGLLVEETKQQHNTLKKNLSSIKESLDYLRVCIKYILFDLEATRRENGYLRKILEDKDI